MSLLEVAGVTTFYVATGAPWFRWIYLASRPSWRTPLNIAKPGAGRMTSDSDFAGLV